MKFVIEYIDDEHINFYVDEIQVGHVNHDVDGWAGMEAIEDLFRRTAKVLGAELIEQ